MASQPTRSATEVHFHCTGCTFYMSANKDGDGEANTSGGAQTAIMLPATSMPSISAAPSHPGHHVPGNNATPDRGAAMAYAPYTNDTTHTASQDWQTSVPVDHTPDANDFHIDPATQAGFDEWLRDYFGPDPQQPGWPGILPDQYGSVPYMPALQDPVPPAPAPNVLAPQPRASQGPFDPSAWPPSPENYQVQPVPQMTTDNSQVYAMRWPTGGFNRARALTGSEVSSASASEEESDETDDEDTLRLSSDDEDRDSEQSATDDDESDDADGSCDDEAYFNPNDDLEALLSTATSTASHSTAEPSASDTAAAVITDVPSNASELKTEHYSRETDTKKRKAGLDTSDTFDKGMEIDSNLQHPPQTKRRQRFREQSENALAQDVGEVD